MIKFILYLQFFTAILLSSGNLFALQLDKFEVLNINTQANQSFILERYDEAESLYDFVDKNISEEQKKYVCTYKYKVSQSEIVKSRKLLGKIEPKAIHKIKVFYITQVNSKAPDVKSQMSEKSINNTHQTLALFKKYIEVLSQGELSINYDVQKINNELTHFDKITYEKDYKYYQPDIESLNPFPIALFGNDYQDYDTFLFYYSNENIDTRATGELINFPINPYQLRIPKRGIMRIPVQLNNACSLAHELFHVVEDVYKIRPRHGYRSKIRKNFKDWKGKGQWEYYLWHYKNTISPKGYQLLNLHKTYPYTNAMDKQKDKIKILSKENLLEAELLFRKVSKKEKKSRKDRKQQLVTALTYNPQHVGILTKLANYEYIDKRYKMAEKYINQAYQINPFNSDTLYQKAKLLRKNKKKKQSMQVIDELIQVDPLYEQAYILKAKLYFSMKEYERSLSSYRQAIAINSSLNKKIKKYLQEKSKKGEKEAANILLSLGLD